MTKRGELPSYYKRNEMTNSARMKSAILRLLYADITESTILLCLAGFALSIGFLVSSVVNTNYSLLADFAPYEVWAGYFFVYSCFRLFLFIYPKSGFLPNAVSVYGLWGWLYIFLSFTVYDSTKVAPTELLLILPCLAEIWLIVRQSFRDMKVNSNAKHIKRV